MSCLAGTLLADAHTAEPAEAVGSGLGLWWLLVAALGLFTLACATGFVLYLRRTAPQRLHDTPSELGKLGTPSKHDTPSELGKLGTPSEHDAPGELGKRGTPSKHDAPGELGKLGTPSKHDAPGELGKPEPQPARRSGDERAAAVEPSAGPT